MRERQKDENFQAFVRRIGKKGIKESLADLAALPEFDEDRQLFYDWSDSRKYTMSDYGVGECAGEVVSIVQFGLTAAERMAFEAQELLDAADYDAAGERAYAAMLRAAKELVRTQFVDITDDPDRIVAEFRSRLYDTQLIFDTYAGGYTSFSINLSDTTAEELRGMQTKAYRRFYFNPSRMARLLRRMPHKMDVVRALRTYGGLKFLRW